MNVFTVLLGKELRGLLRTYRALVVVAVFFLLGLATPLMLKFLPEIIKMSGEQVGIQLPEFTAADVVKSYASDFGQIGLLIVVLVSMASVAGESGGGTAAMVLSKPAGRGRFVLAKFAALALLFVAGLAAAGLGAYLYTSILFGDLSALAFLGANLLLALYLLLAAALTVMFSCLFRSSLAAGACGFAAMILLTLGTSLPRVGRYLPGMLTRWAQAAGDAPGFEARRALYVAAALSVLALLAGWQAFKRKEL